MKHIFLLQELCFISGMFVAILNMFVDDPFWDLALTGIWMILLIAGFSLIVYDVWLMRKKKQWDIEYKKFLEEEREEAEQ